LHDLLFLLHFGSSCAMELVGTYPCEDGELSVVAAPLRQYDVQLRVTDVVAHGQLKQTFVNPTSHTLEVTYCFPVLPSLTVCGFRADLAGSCVQGRVMGKQEARTVYRKALASEQIACLLEKPVGDVMRLSLGALPANAEAVITLDFVLELQTQGAGLRLGFPAVVGGRYPLALPLGAGREERLAADDERAAVAEAARGPGTAAFSFTMDLEMPCAITAVSSPTHEGLSVASSAAVGLDSTTSVRATATLTLPSMPLGEVVVEMTLAAPLVPRCWMEPCAQGYDTAASLVVLHPEAMDLSHLFPSPVSDARPTEFIFLLDRSGSMNGERIQHAAEALQLFLRSLPPGCRFNIVGFGSRFQVLFEGASVAYDETSLKTASEHAQGVKADLGGTELLEPLQFVLEQPATPGFNRALILLTDGAVSNSNRVINLVKQHDAGIYTLGIGRSVSHDLVEGLAAAGGGAAEFAVSSNDRLEAKVVRQLTRAMSHESGIQLTHVEWPDATIEAMAPALHTGRAWRGEKIVLAALLSFEALAGESVRLHFQRGEEQTATMELAISQPQLSSRLHAAVGRLLMEDLDARACSKQGEERQALVSELVALGTRLQLVSKHTSMVAVDEWSVVDEQSGGSRGASMSANHGASGCALQVDFPSPETMVQAIRQKATERWTSGQRTAEEASAVEALYRDALHVATQGMSTTHPLRLETSLAFSGFLQEQGRKDEACQLARIAFEDAIAELDNVAEDSYKESTLIMQNIRDSLTLMTADEDDDDDAAGPDTAAGAASAVAVAASASAAPAAPPPPAAPSAPTACAAVAAATKEDKASAHSLQRLLLLQSFSGSWEASAELSQILGIAVASLSPEGGVSGAAWATALCVAFLQLRLATRSEEWSLVAAKARASISAEGALADDLVAKACTALQASWVAA